MQLGVWILRWCNLQTPFLLLSCWSALRPVRARAAQHMCVVTLPDLSKAAVSVAYRLGVYHEYEKASAAYPRGALESALVSWLELGVAE